MSKDKKQALEFEAKIESLFKEHKSIIEQNHPLTKTEVDRLFEISAEIDRGFEYQSMLLPMIEEEKTQSRWDH
ncbi:MAG: hypothetical protein WC673_00300 [Candidatus Paceibacterota bacterium]|jgi:hypothetical protein